jgi:hypothetical protein
MEIASYGFARLAIQGLLSGATAGAPPVFLAQYAQGPGALPLLCIAYPLLGVIVLYCLYFPVAHGERIRSAILAFVWGGAFGAGGWGLWWAMEFKNANIPGRTIVDPLLVIGCTVGIILIHGAVAALEWGIVWLWHYCRDSRTESRSR